MLRVLQKYKISEYSVNNIKAILLLTLQTFTLMSILCVFSTHYIVYIDALAILFAIQ